jgi:hypothetical protein
MSDPDKLISDYVDGDLDDAGRAALAEELARDKDVRNAFDEALRLEALLSAAHQAGAARGAVDSESSAARPRKRLLSSRGWLIAAAAAVLAAVGLGIVLALNSSTQPRGPDGKENLVNIGPVAAGAEVVEGEVTVGGVRVSKVAFGVRARIEGAGPAVIRLEGATARFEPSSAVIFHGAGSDARQVVSLEEGKGEFDVTPAISIGGVTATNKSADVRPKPFRVDTPVGKVTVLGTKFSVELLPEVMKGEGAMGRKTLAMIVAVAAGTVSVQYNSETHTLTAGMTKAFGVEAKRPPATPYVLAGFVGQVQGVVAGKDDRGNLLLTVKTLVKVFPANKAANPNLIVGRTVPIGPQWVKNDKGVWQKVELQAAFIAKCEKDQELTLNIKYNEGERFAILELTKEQRESAGAAKEGGEVKKGDEPKHDVVEPKKEEGRVEEGNKTEGGDVKAAESIIGKKLVLSEGESLGVVSGVVAGREGQNGSVLKVKVEKFEGVSTWTGPGHKEMGLKAGETAGSSPSGKKRAKATTGGRRGMRSRSSTCSRSAIRSPSGCITRSTRVCAMSS